MAKAELSDTAEVWKPVLGYEGVYEISSLGRVKSLARRTTFRRGGKSVSREVPPCILHNSLSKKFGYYEVNLSDHRRKRRVFVSRLVCEAFHGPAPFPLACVLHWNDIRTDDRASNLRWGTMKDNALDRIRNGRVPRGEAAGSSKLTADQVREIKAQQPYPGLAPKLARQYGVGREAISRIWRGDRWRHI